MSRPRVAVVLGSGGLKCAAAMGLWKVLERHGIAPDLYVGCSGGSFYATGMAMGMSAAEAEDHTRVLWERGMRTGIRFRALAGLLLPGRRERLETFGLLDDRPALEVMRILFEDRTFADLPTPLQLVGTDLHSGERVLMSEGRLVDAVRASVALPLLLAPWRVGGRLLVDGGMTDPLPVSVAIREGADLIIAMGFENPLQDRLDSIRGLISQTTCIAVNGLTRSTFSFYNAVHHAEIIPVLPTFAMSVGLRDSARVPYLIQEGERAAEKALPHIERCLEALHAERGEAVAGMAEAGHG
jgi:NTE family protein